MTTLFEFLRLLSAALKSKLFVRDTAGSETRRMFRFRFASEAAARACGCTSDDWETAEFCPITLVHTWLGYGCVESPGNYRGPAERIGLSHEVREHIVEVADVGIHTYDDVQDQLLSPDKFYYGVLVPQRLTLDAIAQDAGMDGLYAGVQATLQEF